MSTAQITPLTASHLTGCLGGHNSPPRNESLKAISKCGFYEPRTRSHTHSANMGHWLLASSPSLTSIMWTLAADGIAARCTRRNWHANARIVKQSIPAVKNKATYIFMARSSSAAFISKSFSGLARFGTPWSLGLSFEVVSTRSRFLVPVPHVEEQSAHAPQSIQAQ